MKASQSAKGAKPAGYPSLHLSELAKHQALWDKKCILRKSYCLLSQNTGPEWKFSTNLWSPLVRVNQSSLNVTQDLVNAKFVGMATREAKALHTDGNWIMLQGTSIYLHFFLLRV